VIIEQDPDTINECLAEGYLTVLGGASDDEVLEEAGVRRAKGLMAAVDSDADNVFVVLSARKLNPDLHIVARASSDESAAKLEIAGADRTLSPYAVGGRRLASLATHPLIVDFLDIVTHGEQRIEFRLEEFEVPEDSSIADRTIGELRIGERTGAMILATRNKEGTFDPPPQPTTASAQATSSWSSAPANRLGAWSTSCMARSCGNALPASTATSRLECCVVDRSTKLNFRENPF
jgi:voltage-gated potassium channel